MSMTYLQLVNRVLRSLREETVSTVTESTYSTLIADFVNDAKEIVENAWDWSALRSVISVNTTASDNTYSLTGSGDRVKVMDVINDTQNSFMSYRTKHWINKVYLNDSTPEGSPAHYTFDGVDSSGDVIVKLYPTPDGVYNLDFDCVVRPAMLSDNADTVDIPTLPIIYYALAMAARERGEQGGMSSAELFNLGDTYLADAIAMDASKHPEELIFNV